MATYVNNLRLTELATGEGAGTWGTTTNSNLEFIGEALGFGTQAAFASDYSGGRVHGPGKGHVFQGYL